MLDFSYLKERILSDILVYFTRLLLSSTRSSSFRKDWTETRNVLVQYKLVLNLTTGSRKSLTFLSEVPKESKEKDVCRPRYFCRIAHSFCIGLVLRLE